jgi:hypothetical protein
MPFAETSEKVSEIIPSIEIEFSASHKFLVPFLFPLLLSSRSSFYFIA